jgi:3-methyladenine DNA glycosylase AlkD
MTAAETVRELQALGTDSCKKVLLNHGIPEPVFGVKIEELKKFQKRIKKDYQLALDLYDTGIYDAMYLAGLVADEARMTKKDLRHWIATTSCDALCGSTVAWVAAESRHGWDLALEWIESKKEIVATAGWETLGGLVAIKDDADLDLAALKRLLERVGKTIHAQPNRVRYGMNSFLIAVGTYVKDLSDLASKTAERIGVVSVDMGNTSCKVPFAPDYIKKARKRGAIGRKRATVRC